MATIKTDVVTAIDAANPPIANLNEYLGEVKWIPVEYTTLGDESGSTLQLTKKLPTGTKLIAVNLECTGTTSGALSVGYTDAPAAIIVSTAITSDAQIAYPWNGAATAGLGAPIDVGDKIVTATLTSGAAADTINGYILVVTTGL